MRQSRTINLLLRVILKTMKYKRFYITVLFFLLAQMLVAQQNDTVQHKKTKVHIENYDLMTYSKSMGDMQRLIGNVRIRHDSTFFFCDSAYFFEKTNSFNAYQNVHIIVNDSVEIFSDLLHYDGNTRFAEFYYNVRLMDDTEYLTYDRDLHSAAYPNNATTVRGDKTLTSRLGIYRDRIKEFSFFDNVEVLSPKYQMYTDTLFYNTQIEKMWFEGPTTIINKENVLEGKQGYYLVDEDFVFLDKRPFMHNETQQLRSDSIQYDRNIGLAKAFGQVDMIDTSYKVVMRGDYMELWEHRNFSYATDSAYAIYYDKDSLFIHGDTLFFHFKKDQEEIDKLIARRNVRFYKSDMQGKCDTLTYLMADSTIRMRVSPILWAEDSQLSATDIDIKTNGKNIDWVLQKGNAFIISQDSIEGFNQIKGQDITSRFRDGNIHRVNVDGDAAETLYWIRDDEGALIGIDISKSATMVIEMNGNSISVIKGYKDISETMYPESDLNENARKLQGFQWHDEARPKDKNDIFRKAEAEMPQATTETDPSDTPTETPTEPETTAEQPKRHRPKKEPNN